MATLNTNMPQELVSDADIRRYLTENQNITDRDLVNVMNQFGVSPLQMARATSMDPTQIQQRYDVATQQNREQSIADRIAEIQSQGGTQYDIAREASKFNVSPTELAKVTGLPESEIIRMSGGTLGASVPARPTFSGVASEYNVDHYNQFGTFIDLRRASSEAVQNRVKALQDETKRRQEAWDKLYSDTPEGKAIKQEAPPDWRQIYEPWVQTHVDRFGRIVDRPWSTDEAAINQKRELDEKYIQAVQAYNSKYGTNLSPDPMVLGSLSQPSEIQTKEKKDKWYENPLNVAAAIAAIYFGAPYLAEAFGGLETLGATAGTGSAASLGGLEVLPGLGAEVIPLGEAGLTTVSAIPGTTAGATTLGAFGPLGAASDISSLAPYITQTPGVGTVGNFGFGAAVPTVAETTAALIAAGISPGTAANIAGATLAGVGAAAPSALSLKDILRTANTARDILSTDKKSDTQPTGIDKDTANLLAQGLSMLQPGSNQYALPGSLESTYLAPGSGATQQQAQFLAQLKQLYPELRGADDNLLSTIASRTGVAAAKGGHIPEFITGATGHYVQGRGDGQSDEIPAMLADGEYVFDADTVAALGNGSNKAGAKVLDQMRQNIRQHKRGAPTDKIPPKAKSPLEYLRG